MFGMPLGLGLMRTARRPAEGGGPPFDFTIVAGSISGISFGYAVSPATGTLDTQPIGADNALTGALSSFGTTTFTFIGDVAALLNGYDLKVKASGTTIPLSTWAYDAETNRTSATKSSPNLFANGGTYAFTWAAK